MLEIENLSTYYGQCRAISDISLRVDRGDFIAIIGPNGHGKSTFLKTVCGLLKPKTGSVRYEGTELVGLPTYRIVEMGIVYVAEERHLFPEMTVQENLILGAYNHNARKVQEDNFDLVFDLFPRLKERKKQVVSTLSGGESRMVALGRGLMSNAKIIAIDEPSFGLAPNLRMEVFNRIKEINNKGITIILVEQTVAEAMHLIDRFYLMEDGHIVFEGTEAEALSSEHVKQAFLGI
jgi:branched-chain amino acid transport system ATP-binding protein